MRWLLLTTVPLITVGSALLGIYDREPTGPDGALAAALTAQPTTSGCETPPTLSYTIPSDIAGANTQANVNCLAWQDFIAVNWQASPKKCSANAAISAAKFGEPNNTALVVWETYKEASDVFQKDAAPPSPWCSGELLTHGNKSLGLRFTQAGTGGAWLTAQNHHLALYEIRMNRDAFSYIEANRLYDATTQEAFAENSGIDLPDGTAEFSQYGETGSMVFKASWIELPDPSQWPFFKTSKAYVVDPGSNGPPRPVTVGLVGLHIIHKTAKSPQFIWATFEHVNNAPSAADIKNNALRSWYTFYNAHCNPRTDHYRCNPNAQPIGNSPDHPVFPRYPADPYDAPVQVVRENSISHTTFNDVAGLNQWVWKLIRAGNPNSVFVNYQLVDVLWANAPAAVPIAAAIPLTAGNPLPNPAIHKVANTTLETYFQNTSTCLDCHTKAAIASAGATKTMASDYSFLFGVADSSASRDRDLRNGN
jgi:hypothetical protein